MSRSTKRKRKARLVEQILECSSAWRSDRRFQVPVREEGFDDALQESLPRLSSRLGTDLDGFMTAVHTEAAFDLRILDDENGLEYVAHTELFLVPVEGDLAQIEAVTEDDLGFLWFGIQRSGMFTDGTLVGILPRLVSTSEVTNLSVGDLARITRELGDVVLLEDRLGDRTPESVELLDDIAARLTDTATKTRSRATRCIFGARVVFLEIGEGIPTDCLFPSSEEMAEIGEAIDEWIEFAHSHVSHGVCIGDPAIWTSSVPTLLAIEASADLDDQMRSRGIANSGLPGVTLALDHDVSEAVVHLTASVGERIVGHTRVARAGVMLDYGAFHDALEERYATVRMEERPSVGEISASAPAAMLN